MAYRVARLNDTSNHGGIIISASGNVKANGVGVARVGDLHSCPISGHGTTSLSHVTATGAWNVNGRQAINEGDIAACGAVINTGSPNVFAS